MWAGFLWVSAVGPTTASASAKVTPPPGSFGARWLHFISPAFREPHATFESTSRQPKVLRSGSFNVVYSLLAEITGHVPGKAGARPLAQGQELDQSLEIDNTLFLSLQPDVSIRATPASVLNSLGMLGFGDDLTVATSERRGQA